MTYINERYFLMNDNTNISVEMQIQRDGLRQSIKDLESEYRLLQSEKDFLSARLAIAVEALDTLTGLVNKLKSHLSTDGEYSISRTDKENMRMGEVLMLGDLLKKIDAIVAKAALEKIKELK